jgi:hypothetical protein
VKSCLQSSIFNVLVLVLSMSLAISAHQRNKRKAAQNPSRPPTVRFISANNSVKTPSDLSSNLILIQARVNDSGPLWFILDTGADRTVIDSELAKDLHLRPRGKVVGTGSAGIATAIIYRGVSMKFPNVEALNLKISGLPIDFLSAPLRRKISGVIGNDILKELVVEVDYANQVINLYEPKSYIDGRPAKELTINQIRKMFMQHGKEYLVSLKRGQTDVRTKLRLRRLV